MITKCKKQALNDYLKLNRGKGFKKFRQNIFFLFFEYFNDSDLESLSIKLFPNNKNQIKKILFMETNQDKSFEALIRLSEIKANLENCINEAQKRIEKSKKAICESNKLIKHENSSI